MVNRLRSAAPTCGLGSCVSVLPCYAVAVVVDGGPVAAGSSRGIVNSGMKDTEQAEQEKGKTNTPKVMCQNRLPLR